MTKTIKALMFILVVILSINATAQTNNYFGTSGTITGSVWSTNIGGPYTSALSGGTYILNFNNTGSATGASISPMPTNWNFGAAITWSAGGTIGAAATNVNLNISSGVLQDFGGSQAFSTSATAAFTKSGAGAVAFTASSAYGGGFTLNNGTMVIRGANALGNGTISLNGGVLAANAARNISVGSIVFGGNTQFGEVSSNVSLAGANNISFTAAVPVALGASIRTITLGNAATHSFLGVISGSGGLNFDANSNGTTGTFALATGNTYTGKSQLLNGIVSGSGESIFGANPGSFVADQITLNGGTLSASGALSFNSNRGITLTGTSNTLNCNSNKITLTNIVTGSGGFTKTGSGASGDTLLLNGAHSFTGAVTVANGYLKLNTSNVYPNTSALSISSGAFLDLKANSDTIGSLAGAGTVTSGIAGSPTLTVGGDNNSTTYSGAIQNGSGTVALSKYGSGTLTLTGTNTYTGTTTINAGTLKLNRTGGTTIPTTNSCVVNGGTLQISNNQSLVNVTVASGATLTMDASTTLTITGTLTIAAGAIINGTGAIAYSSGALVYNATGSLTAGIEWPTTSVPTSVTIGATDTVILSATRTTTTTLTVNGVLNAAANSITGTGTVNINGVLITTNLNGLTGTGATFTGATPTLGVSSTVEYAATAGSQVITTSPSYINLTLSSGGTKTASSSLAISSTLTISGSTIFNAGNSTIGGTGTNLTMTGTSKFILAGTGTRPSATGTYSLAATSTIEFSNIANTQQDIRLSPTYGNIDISGTNVGLSGTSSSLTLQSGSIFTVKSGGIFNVINSNGFAGVSNSAISNTNTPTISLPAGSTINFSSSSAQNINARTFSKVYITGGSTKTMTGDITVNDSLKITSGKLAIAGNILTIGSTITSDANHSLIGSSTSKLSITSTSNAGTVYMDQTTSADVATTTGTNALQNLVLNGTSGSVTLGNKTNLFGKLSVKNGTLNTGGVLILRSISSNTAYVDSVGGSISGQVVVERYIHKQARGWRAITAPVTFNGIVSSDNDKVTNNWQSNFGYSNYGTRISGPAANTAINGLDDATTGSSLQTYNSTTGAWTKVTNTKTETQSGSSATAANKGFFMFIRGDRTVTPANNTPNTFVTTTIATKGLLQTGTQTFNFAGTANKSWLIGNPYPAPVQMDSVIFNNIGNAVYVWDPNRTGSSPNTNGQYVTFDRTNWDLGPTAGSTNKYFQSGQAFFIVPTSATASITFNERYKTTATNNNTQITGAANNLSDIFNVKLYSINADATKNEIDGVRVKYGANYNAAVDANDAVKWASTEIENLSLTRNTKQLSIEARPYIVGTDSLFLNLTNLAVGANYEFKINPINFDATVSSCKLYDNFLNTITPIALSSNTQVSFNVTNVVASSAANRFYIVFNGAGSLGCSTLVAKAYKKNNNVIIDWNATCESNLKTYEIEKSVDGIRFKKMSSHTPKNSSTTAQYNTTDNNAVNDINFYRVKAVQANGSFIYSNTVFVKLTAASNGNMVSFPNPSTGVFNVAISTKSKASEATIELVNLFGKIIKTYTTTNNNGNINFTVNATDVSNGLYMLQYQVGNEKGATSVTISR